jgi:hypothetical protein
MTATLNDQQKELADDFNGDTPKLISCIEALLALDASGSLVPHGIGGHARKLLSAAAVRLATPARASDAPAEQSPIPDDIQRDIERSDWTSEEALRWYAAGKHFDTVNGRTRIIDTGAVASNALKHTSVGYHAMKGADASFPAPATAPAALTDLQREAMESAISALQKCGWTHPVPVIRALLEVK